MVLLCGSDVVMAHVRNGGMDVSGCARTGDRKRFLLDAELSCLISFELDSVGDGQNNVVDCVGDKLEGQDELLVAEIVRCVVVFPIVHKLR